MKVIELCSQAIPLYTESYSGDYIAYGNDNLFPQFLQELSLKSAKHSSILKTKEMLIAGNGINTDNLSDEAKLFIRNIHGKETLDEIVKKLARDLEMFGGFAMGPGWSRDKSNIARIEYVDFSNVRKQRPDPKRPDVTKYWVGSDWSVHNNNPLLYSEFSSVDRSKGNQILYFSETGLMGEKFYPVPTYYAAVNYIDIDYSIAEFHRNGIKNGFSPSYMIDLIESANITDEERDMIFRDMVRQYTGVGNAGKIILTFSESIDKRPQITPVEMNTSDERFIELLKITEKEIFIGHQVTQPKLFGVMAGDGSVISSAQDLVQDLAIFQSMYVRPKQIMIENELNKLARINGITDKFTLNPYVLDIQQKLSVEQIIQILTSTITNEQKMQIFMMYGYSRTEAEDIVIDKNKIV